MAQEEKQCCGTEKKCCDPKKTLTTFFKLLLGLVFVILGGWAIYNFWGELVVIIKGGIGLFLILAGVITLAIAKE